jgi:fido (protein-threonine AMPylation protein)
VQKPEQKAPDDPGAFGMLTSEQQRALDGAAYHVLARLVKTQRTSDDWHHSLLVEIHRNLFGSVFPEHAGKVRSKEVTFRNHEIPPPGQILYRLQDIVHEAKAIVRDARSINDEAERIVAIIPRIARFHATCVIVQPFIDGNKRWARQVLNAIMNDTGFDPGTLITELDREQYLDGIDKAIGGYPEQLGNLILLGWIALEDQYRSGLY